MEALLIDVDGTIINSYPGVVASYEQALAEVGVTHPPHIEKRTVLGPPMVVSFAKAGVPEHDIARARAAYMEAYAASGWDNASVYPGIPAMLEWAKEQGLYLATATSKGEYFTLKVLEHFGLLDYFDFIGTAGKDGVERPTKADVVGYVLDSANLRGKESSVLMIGDRIHDFEGAAAHGLDTIAAAWGYGTDEERTLAAYVAKTPADIATICNDH